VVVRDPVRERPVVAARLLCALLLAALAGLPAAAQQPRRAAPDHLRIETSASEQVVAPGTRFSLLFDITPAEKIHVYAPGDHSYKVIRVNLQPSGWLIVHPTEYPASEMYDFVPLKERVPVFQKPFRLRQPVEVSGAPEHRAALAKMNRITIRGTLEYQACDDRLCYPPKSIPLSYTVRLRRPA
jgi:hypothetical protein